VLGRLKSKNSRHQLAEVKWESQKIRDISRLKSTWEKQIFDFVLKNGAAKKNNFKSTLVKKS